MEHEAKLEELEKPNAFISEPVFPRSLWDEIQGLHPKTLAWAFVIAGKSRYLDVRLEVQIDRAHLRLV